MVGVNKYINYKQFSSKQIFLTKQKAKRFNKAASIIRSKQAPNSQRCSKPFLLKERRSIIIVNKNIYASKSSVIQLKKDNGIRLAPSLLY